MNRRHTMHSTASRLAAALAVVLLAACQRAPREGPDRQEASRLPPPLPTYSPALTDAAARVEWLSREVPAVFPAGQSRHIKVTLRHAGNAPWPDPMTTGGLPNAVLLSYHWLTPDRKMHFREGHRDGLGRMVDPGEEIVAKLEVKAPEKPGQYILQIDLLQGAQFWFAEKGNAPLEVPVTVR